MARGDDRVVPDRWRDVRDEDAEAEADGAGVNDGMSDGERCAACPIKEAPRKGRRLRGADELAREIAKAPAVAADVLRGRITVDQAERRIYPEKYDIKKARKR